MLMLDVWAILYAALTVWTYGGADADRLEWMVSGPELTGWRLWVTGGREGPGFAVQLAVLALAAAAVLPMVERFAPAATDRALLTVLIIVAVVVSWLVVTLSYAVHYARRDRAGGGIVFPGTVRGQFVDYLYFSISVATTFGTTDVEDAPRRHVARGSRVRVQHGDHLAAGGRLGERLAIDHDQESKMGGAHVPQPTISVS